MLAISHPPLLPSAIMDGVGPLIYRLRGWIPRLPVLLSTLHV